MPITILSKNMKTGESLNLPIKNCTPSKRCAKECYGRSGFTRLDNAIRKSVWVSKYLLGNNISQLVTECLPFNNLRLCGNGDLLTGHVKNIIKLAEKCKHTKFWGFTRKPNIANRLNDLLPNLYMQLSIDDTTPSEVYDGYTNDIAFGPKGRGIELPEDQRIKVSFPYHCHGRVVNGVLSHRLDCQGVVGDVKCVECRRCFQP